MDIVSLFSGVDWVTFLVAMCLLELTPGPNMGWLAALSAQKGRRVGFTAVLGISLGLLVQLLAAATGLSALIGSSDVVYNAIRWAGVAFMLWLAWEAFSDTGSAPPGKGSARAGFTRGLVANILNPKALFFYIVVVGQFADPEKGMMWVQIMLLGLIHLSIAIIVHSLIVVLGDRLGASLERWRTSFYTRLVFALLLVLIAIWIAFTTGR